MTRTFGLLTLVVLVGCSNKLKPVDDEDTDLPVDTDDTDVVDTDTAPPEDDADGDGFTESQGDCDDTDEDVFPGAPELCNDQDDDCDGKTDDDFDQDEDGIADCRDNCPILVDVHAEDGAQNGTYTDPFVSIQDAIDAAEDLACSVIQVRAGSYRENLDFGGQDLLVASKEGPAKTLLMGDRSGPVVRFANFETADAEIRGFRITGGGGSAGGGIYVNGADPTIVGNEIIDNILEDGDKQGGGIYLFDSDAYVGSNLISGNEAGVDGPEAGCDGGGLFVRGGAPVIEGNAIVDNIAGDGGGIWFARSDALVITNDIIANVARDTDPVKGGQGGGVDIQIGTADFYMAGNVIAENEASTHGGGVAIYEYAETEGDPWIVNNTFAFNTVTDTDYGAALVGWSTTRGHVVNNVFYQNPGVAVWLNATTQFSYNDLYGNTTALGGDQPGVGSTNGNVAVDPRFVGVSDDGDWHNDDWALQGSSPLKRAGDPSIQNADGSRSDIGASGGPYAE